MSPSTRAQCTDRNQAKAQLAHPARSTTVACGTSAALSFRISSRIASRCLSRSRRLTLFVKLSAVFFALGTLVNWLTRLEAALLGSRGIQLPSDGFDHNHAFGKSPMQLNCPFGLQGSIHRTAQNPDHSQDFSFRSPY